MAILDDYKNLSLAQVATPPSPAASGTSVTFVAGHGAYLPAPPFNATVFGGGTFPTPANAEIIRVTAIVGDVATILRTQEGSIARTILATDYVAATFTTKFVTDLRDSSNQNAGTLPDARLSANVPRLNAPNVFTASPQQIGPVATPRLLLFDTVPPANARVFQIIDAFQSLRFEAIDDAGLTPLSAPLILTRLGDAAVARDVSEKGRTTPLGHWIDFTPTLGASAGAVSGVNNAACHYTLIGKTCLLGFYISFTLSAPASVTIALPAGIVSAGYNNTTIMMGITATVPGTAQATPGGTALTFLKDTGGTLWAAGPHTLAATVTVAIQ